MILEFCNYKGEKTFISNPACVDEAFYDIQEYAGRRRFTPRFYKVEQMEEEPTWAKSMFQDGSDEMPPNEMRGRNILHEWWKVNVGAREEYFCIREYEPEDLDELMDVLKEMNSM